jgi:hypothetical protein
LLQEEKEEMKFELSNGNLRLPTGRRHREAVDSFRQLWGAGSLPFEPLAVTAYLATYFLAYLPFEQS